MLQLTRYANVYLGCPIAHLSEYFLHRIWSTDGKLTVTSDRGDSVSIAQLRLMSNYNRTSIELRLRVHFLFQLTCPSSGAVTCDLMRSILAQFNTLCRARTRRERGSYEGPCKETDAQRRHS